jgi:flagellin
MAGSESKIRDTDFAFETAEMSKHQIMQQAGTAILSQANSLPQSALRLI